MPFASLYAAFVFVMQTPACEFFMSDLKLRYHVICRSASIKYNLLIEIFYLFDFIQYYF